MRERARGRVERSLFRTEKDDDSVESNLVQLVRQGNGVRVEIAAPLTANSPTASMAK